MENTLEINDRVLVNKLVYDVRGIHRGDIVVFNGDGSWDPGTVPTDTNFVVKFADGFASMFGFGHPGDILIKRVIGLPGDQVACCDAQGRVTVNGVPLTEQSYLYPGDAPSEIRFNILVPPGRLWVMGDHRLISDDSRRSSRRSRRRHGPGKRRGRPGLRHHLAAQPVADPADSRHLRAAEAERRGGRRPPGGPGHRRPAPGPAGALQPGPAAGPRLRRGRPGHLAAAPGAAATRPSPRARAVPPASAAPSPDRPTAAVPPRATAVGRPTPASAGRPCGRPPAGLATAPPGRRRRLVRATPATGVPFAVS